MTGITSGYPTPNYTILLLFSLAGAFESYAPSLLHIYLI